MPTVEVMLRAKMDSAGLASETVARARRRLVPPMSTPATQDWKDWDIRGLVDLNGFDGHRSGCWRTFADLFEFDAFGFGEAEDDEDEGGEAEEAVHAEGGGAAHGVDQGAEGEGDDEVDEAIGGGGGGDAASAYLDGE